MAHGCAILAAACNCSTSQCTASGASRIAVLQGRLVMAHGRTLVAHVTGVVALLRGVLLGEVGLPASFLPGLRHPLACFLHLSVCLQLLLLPFLTERGTLACSAL